MKKLLMIAVLTSCGYVKVPLFESHMDDDDHSSDDESRPVVVQSALIYECSSKAYTGRCTNVLPTNRILHRIELYDTFCYNDYRFCLQAQ